MGVFEDMQRGRAIADQREREHAEWKNGQQREGRDRRRDTRRRWSAWITTHAQSCVMAVVIVAPLLLSWSAMTGYGTEIYGPLGVILPLLTEAGMVAFSLAIQSARATGQSVAVLAGGLALTASAAATMSALNGLQESWQHGAVMAVVSVSGVAIHQAWTHSRHVLASAAQRRERRYQRSVSRRVHRIRTRAGREAPVQIDEHGQARVCPVPASVSERRSPITLRRRNVYAEPAQQTPAPAASDGFDAVAGGLGEDVSDWLRGDLLAPHPPTEPPVNTPSSRPSTGRPDTDEDPSEATSGTPDDLQPGRVDTPGLTPPHGADQQPAEKSQGTDSESPDEPSGTPDDLQSGQTPRGRTFADVLADYQHLSRTGQIERVTQRHIREQLRCSWAHARRIVDLHHNNQL